MLGPAHDCFQISMKPLAPLLLVVALLAGACSGGGDSSNFAICAQQRTTINSDGLSVTVCEKTFAEAPMVRLPPDERGAAVQTIFGVIDLDVRLGENPGEFVIEGARLLDRKLVAYDLAGADGVPVTEKHPLMQAMKLPSSRVHYLVYEARGTIAGNTLRLESLKPVVMVAGRAIDERFLGAWEGTFSLYDGDRVWSEDTAKVRVEFAALVPHTDMDVVTPGTGTLPDGTRFKAVGGVANGDRRVRLSTGECAPALTSLQQRNPLLEASDYLFTLWRFPAMHTASSKDFHVVNDYPRALYPSAIGMAAEHNFRLVDYIAETTAPKELVFHIHGNPVQQMTMTLTPVKGGGGGC